MKQEDVKQRIDSYLDSVSAEELFQTLTGKYGMGEYDMNDPDTVPDERIAGNAMIALLTGTANLNATIYEGVSK